MYDQNYKKTLACLLSLSFVFSSFGAIQGTTAKNSAKAYIVQDDTHKIRDFESGMFTGGAAWKYDRENRKLFINGFGRFEVSDLEEIIINHDTDCVIIGQSVVIPEDFDTDTPDGDYKVFVLTESMTPDDIDYVKEEQITEGKFEGGADWHYQRSRRCLIIDGGGTFDKKEYQEVFKQFREVDVVVFGKDVIYPEIPDEELAAPGNEYKLDLFMHSLTALEDDAKSNSAVTYTYKGSDLENKFEKYLARYSQLFGGTIEYYKEYIFGLNIMPDDADPYSYEYKKYSVSKSSEDAEGTFESGVKWNYNSDFMELMVYGKGNITVDEFREIRQKYYPEYIVMGKNVQIDDSEIKIGNQTVSEFAFHFTNCAVDVFPLIYSYKGSEIQHKYDDMVEKYTSETGNNIFSADATGILLVPYIQYGSLIDPLTADRILIADEGCVLKGYSDTEAQYYADANGYTFVPLDETAQGDINADGMVSVTDLVLLVRWLTGDSEVALKNWKSGDFNKDGVLNVVDLLLLKSALLDT